MDQPRTMKPERLVEIIEYMKGSETWQYVDEPRTLIDIANELLLEVSRQLLDDKRTQAYQRAKARKTGVYRVRNGLGWNTCEWDAHIDGGSWNLDIARGSDSCWIEIDENRIPNARDFLPMNTDSPAAAKTSLKWYLYKGMEEELRCQCDRSLETVLPGIVRHEESKHCKNSGRLFRDPLFVRDLRPLTEEQEAALHKYMHVKHELETLTERLGQLESIIGTIHDR
jgi:hypothetical protein